MKEVTLYEIKESKILLEDHRECFNRVGYKHIPIYGSYDEVCVSQNVNVENLKIEKICTTKTKWDSGNPVVETNVKYIAITNEARDVFDIQIKRFKDMERMLTHAKQQVSDYSHTNEKLKQETIDLKSCNYQLYDKVEKLNLQLFNIKFMDFWDRLLFLFGLYKGIK